MGKRGPKPLGRVNCKWSPALCYSIGLLATDGNLSGDGRHIDLTSKDKEQIGTFQNCLELHDIKIDRKASGYTKRKDYYRIQFSDSKFHGWLTGIGITPRKSKTIGQVKIPAKYFFDFLRGCFDGDGCIYSYWDPRWKSSYMFYTVFTSASIKFLEWLRQSIEKLAAIEGRITTGGRGTYQLRFAKAGTMALLNKMFYSANVPHLKRKYEKAQKIIRQNSRTRPDGGIGLRSGLRGRAS